MTLAETAAHAPSDLLQDYGGSKPPGGGHFEPIGFSFDEYSDTSTAWAGSTPPQPPSFTALSLPMVGMKRGFEGTFSLWNPPHVGTEGSSMAALTNTIDLEQNSVTFDPVAMTLLARIFERGHATCQELAEWLESPDEWIAFSRLQRSRLLNDSGTEFTVSRGGRRLIHCLLDTGTSE